MPHRTRTWGAVLGLVAAGLLTIACAWPPAAGAQAEEPPPPELERFLVFTDGAPAAADAVKAAVARHAGAVADEVRVAPDLTMLVVSVPRSAVPELAGIPGVREVAPEVVPSPAGPSGDAPPEVGG